MARRAPLRVLTGIVSVVGVVLAGIGLAPPASAAAVVDDYGVVLVDGIGFFDVAANDGFPDPSGTNYVVVTSSPDPDCSWICSTGGTLISVDPTVAPSPPSGIVSIGYELFDGDSGASLGSAHLDVAIVPDHLDVTSGNGEMTVDWPGMPSSIGGLDITYDTSYVSDHDSSGTDVSTTGNGSRTITGLTNGTTYHVYVTPYFHGVDLEVGCGGPCGLTGQTTPRAVNHLPVAVDDTVTVVGPGDRSFSPTVNDEDDDGDDLTVSGHTTPVHGDVTCDPFSCTYTAPAPPVDDSFDYTVSDGYGGSDTGTVHVVARTVTATSDTATTFVDEPVDVDVLGNDNGIQPDDFVEIDAAPGVTATWDDTVRRAVITGVDVGTSTVPYTVYSADGTELASAQVTVTVGAARPLFASDDHDSGTELDVPVDIQPSDNDHILPAGFPLSNAGTSITQAPTHGTAVLTFSPQNYFGPNGEGTGSLQNLPEIHYTPDQNFLGTDHLTYRITDAQGHTDTALVTIPVGVPANYYVDATPGIGSAQLAFVYSSSPAVDDVMACYTVGTDRTTYPAPPSDRTACAHELALPSGTPQSFSWTGLTNDVVYAVTTWVHSDDGTPNGVWSHPVSDTFRPGVRPVRDVSGDGGVSTLQLSWTNPSAPQGSTGTTLRYSTVAAPTTPTGGAGGVSVGPGLASASITGLSPGTYYVSVFSTNTGTFGDPRTVTLKVAPGNQPPVVTTDTLTLNENDFAYVPVLANDSDPDGDPLDVKSWTQPAHGDVDCFGDAASGDDWSCRYEPVANYVGTDSFTYIAWDHRFGESTGTVNVTVNQVNTAPHAADDSLVATTVKATPVDLTQDASDLEGNTLTYSIVTPPAHGTLTCPTPNTGLCSYTSAAAYTGPDSFVWKATDNGTNPANLSSNDATMSISVVANQPPTVSDQQVSANNGVAKTFSVATDASDPDGDTLAFSKASDPQKGTVTCTAAGSCTYTAAGNASGQDSFTFQASDGHGGVATGSVLITITHVNRPPVAGDTTVTTTNATPVVTNVAGLSTDPDGDPLSFSKVSGPTGTNAGTVTCSGSSCTYTPSSSFTGTTTYTYAASDGALSDNGVVTVTVTQANRAPVAVNDATTAQPAQQVTVNVAANDSDPDGDPLTFALNSQAVHGTAACAAGGQCTYQSTGGFTGQDQFTYTVSDNHGHSAGATVTINVSNLNHAPVANGATKATDNGGPFAIDLTALTTDADAGDQLTWTKVDGPTPASAGTLTCTAGGQCTFTPASGFTGPMTFHYKANDGHVDSNTAAVTVNVAQANRAPHAVDDAGTTRVDTALTIPVLANDTDADGDTLTFTKVTDPAHGSISCATTPCVYTPASGFAGSDSFTYKASDGRAASNVATVQVTVVANRAPVAAGDSLTTVANRAGTVDVAANDTDADGDTLTYAAGAAPAHGTVACTAAGSCTYTPTAGYTGPDTFGYTVGDGHGGQATGTVAVTVTPIQFVFTAAPKVTGKTKVGKVLTAKKGTFTPAGATVTYTWLRNGKAIKRAKAATYKLTTKDRGKLISVRLTYSAPGAQTVVKTVKVAKRIT